MITYLFKRSTPSRVMDWKKFNRGVFLVNVLGIVYDRKSKRIIIGRGEKDPYMKTLSWRYPGGRPAYKKDLGAYLKLEVRKKTNLNVKVVKVIHARTYKQKRQFLSIYYYCESSGKAKAGESFKEIKWIKPTDIQKYFSKSVSKTPKEVYNFLKSLK